MTTCFPLKIERAAKRLSSLLAVKDEYEWTHDPALTCADNLAALVHIKAQLLHKLKCLTDARDDINSTQTAWMTALSGITDSTERKADDARLTQQDNDLNISVQMSAADALASKLHLIKLMLEQHEQRLNNQIQAATTATQLSVPLGSTPGVTEESHVRLPVLELAPFRGNKLEWPEFWENYDAAVHSSRLPPGEKFLYLRKYVQGEAHLVIEGLPRTEANYQIAIDLLKEKYGNSAFLQRELREQLLALKPARSMPDSRHLHLEIEKIIRQMHNGGENIDADWIQDTIIRKFPDEVGLKIVETQLQTDSWNTAKLRETIKKIMAAAEALDDITRTRSSQPKVSQQAWKAQQKDDNRAYISAAQQPPCPFCNAAHWAVNCSSYEVKSRHDRALELRLCFKCLRRGHRTPDCDRKGCAKCHQPHHIALCHRSRVSTRDLTRSERDNGSVSDKDQRGSSPQPDFGEKTAVADADSQIASLFLSARAEIVPSGKAKSIPVVVFIDSGSHRTFIKRSLADKLRGQRKHGLIQVMPFGGTVLEMDSYQLDIELKTQNGTTLKVTAHAVDEMPEAITLAPIQPEDVSRLQAGRIPIAGTFDPDLLIGINVWSQLKLVYNGELPCGLSLQSSVLGPMVCGKGFVNTQTAIHDIKTVSVLTSLEFIGPTETAPEAPADRPTSPEKRFLLRNSRPPRDQPSRRPAKQVGENYARRQQSRRPVCQVSVNFKADSPLEYLTRPAARFHSRAVNDPPWKTDEEPGPKRKKWTDNGQDPEDRRPTYPSSPGVVS